MTTLHIHSTGLIYSPGLFAWIVQAVLPHDDKRARELLEAFGVPVEFIEDIVLGRFETETDGETLVVHLI
jgi:hypothetical protein